MILNDLITDARKILIDTNSANYRWDDDSFIDWFRECVEIIYSHNVNLFLDELGNIEKGTYRNSSLHVVSTAYVLGDIVHNSDDEMFECTTVAGGTSAGTAPTWVLGYEAETIDNDITWENLERNDIPFPDHTKNNLIAFLIAKAYEIDSTDQNNYQLSQAYMQQFGDIL